MYLYMKKFSTISLQNVNELASKLAVYKLPAYDNVQSLLLSKGGAQLLHMACMAGNVTPYNEQHAINNIVPLCKLLEIRHFVVSQHICWGKNKIPDCSGFSWSMKDQIHIKN